MPTDYTILRLGPVVFSGFEIPDTIPLGGTQRLIVTELAGNNKRMVQRIGAQPRAIDWEGEFFYESAIARARFLDTMRVRGEPLGFVWGDFQYIVIIDNFEFDPSNRFEIPYKISLTVVQDLTSPAESAVSRDTIEIGIINEVNKLNTLLSVIRQMVGVVEAAQRGDLRGAIGAISGVVNAIATAGSLAEIDSIDLRALATQTQVAAAGVLAVAESFDRIDDGVTATVAVVEATNSLLILSGLLNRLVAPPFVQNHTVVKDNLFAISSRYYGNLESWEDIAEFNGLNEAQLLGPQTVKLPTINGIVPKESTSAGTVYESGTYEIAGPGSANAK